MSAPSDTTTGAPAVRDGHGATFFYFVSVALVAAGFVVMFVYQPDPFGGGGFGEVVGGDAYNFIIIAVRGVGFIGAGIVFAVFGLAAQLADAAQAKRGP